MANSITLPSLAGNTLDKLCGAWPTPKFTVALARAARIVLDIVFHPPPPPLVFSLCCPFLFFCSLSDAVKSENVEIYM